MPSTPAPTPNPNDVVDAAGFTISKTRRKQASHDLQDLGTALVALPDDRLDRLPLGEPLTDAIREYRRTRSHEGRRRQMQYIGKLMRRVDAEPLREAVAAAQLGSATDALQLHQAERWRAELIADDAASTRWLAAHPGADAQALRAAVRAARKDAAAAPEQRSGRAFRELFRVVREQLQVDAAGALDGDGDDEPPVPTDAAGRDSREAGPSANGERRRRGPGVGVGVGAGAGDDANDGSPADDHDRD